MLVHAAIHSVHHLVYCVYYASTSRTDECQLCFEAMIVVTRARRMVGQPGSKAKAHCLPAQYGLAAFRRQMHKQ